MEETRWFQENGVYYCDDPAPGRFEIVYVCSWRGQPVKIGRLYLLEERQWPYLLDYWNRKVLYNWHYTKIN